MSVNENQPEEVLQALVFLEEKIHGLDCFCRVVDEAAGDNSPHWLCSVWSLTRSIEKAMEPISVHVRGLVESRGEGPRSGGGAATSGAGAQRKEGVQPPGDLPAAVEVQQRKRNLQFCSPRIPLNRQL